MDEQRQNAKDEASEGTDDTTSLENAESSGVEHGVVLGIRQSSCLDRLPEDIKKRREEFLREQEADLKQGGVQDKRVSDNEVTARFASRLERVKQMTRSDPKKSFLNRTFMQY